MVLSRVSNTRFNCNNLMWSCCCMPAKSGVACDACLMLCFGFSFFFIYLSFLVIAVFLFLSSIMHIISPFFPCLKNNGEVQKNKKVTDKIELHTLCLRANSSSWFLKVASCSFIRSVRILATFSPRDRYWSCKNKNHETFKHFFLNYSVSRAQSFFQTQSSSNRKHTNHTVGKERNCRDLLVQPQLFAGQRFLAASSS